MTALAEVVGSLSGLEIAGLLPLAVALAVWPAAVLAARRGSRPAPPQSVVFRPGRARVRFDVTLVDVLAGASEAGR